MWKCNAKWAFMKAIVANENFMTQLKMPSWEENDYLKKTFDKLLLEFADRQEEESKSIAAGGKWPLFCKVNLHFKSLWRGQYFVKVQSTIK